MIPSSSTLRHCYGYPVSSREIDIYLANLSEPQRDALQHLRFQILAEIPEAEECISYGLPAFRINGKVVAGFGAFKNHLSYFPHSGAVLPSMADEIERYRHTKSALHFTTQRPLPDSLVRTLLAAKLALVWSEAGGNASDHTNRRTEARM